MDMILKGGFLNGRKTYITSAVGIITSVAAYLTGTMDLAQLIQSVFPLAGLMFVRRGVQSVWEDRPVQLPLDESRF